MDGDQEQRQERQLRNDTLRDYYQSVMPAKLLWLIFCTDNEKSPRREFSFRCNDTDVVLRYTSFQLYNHFHAYFTSKLPTRCDVGPVYPFPVDRYFLKAHSEQNYSRRDDTATTIRNEKLVVERELVFDIDVDDYSKGYVVRKDCCSDGQPLCKTCWVFLACAIKVLNYVLRKVYCFKHLLFVFSGRRGVHCWVGDTRARLMSESARRGIVEFFKTWKPLYESQGNIPQDYMREVYQDIMLPMFESTFGMEKADSDPSLTREEVIYRYMMPRIDEPVTVSNTHLLKMPFCIHPATQSVCVPIDPETCEAFDFTAVPKLSFLEQHSPKEMMKEHIGPHIKILQQFYEGIRSELGPRKIIENTLSDVMDEDDGDDEDDDEDDDDLFGSFASVQ